MNKVVKYTITAIIFLLTISFFRCKKSSSDYVPNVAVDIYVYNTDPAFAPLNAVGGYAYLTGGSKGILVYRGASAFMAYDRECTYNVSSGNVISVDASALTATDATCGSKFLITDGSVNHGPATNPLKRYQATYDGTVLHITN